MLNIFVLSFRRSALRNCEVHAILLPDAPQAFYIATGMYHVLSRSPTLKFKTDCQIDVLSICNTAGQACVTCHSCSSTRSFNKCELVLHPEMHFCATRPELFLASIELTPSFNQVLFMFPLLVAPNFRHIPLVKLVNWFLAVYEYN